jgi:NTE family protein
LALVLSGGGAKGAYQLGVVNALMQYGLYDKISGFSGASIGALNIALIESVGIDKAIDTWQNRISDIFFSDSINFYEIMNMLKNIKTNTPLKKSYLCDRKNLVELFEEFQIHTLSASDKVMYASTVDITDVPKELRSIRAALSAYDKLPVGNVSYLALNYKNTENIYKVLLASSALPLIFEPIEINDKHYIDGGLIDNIPIKPLYDYGYKNIIIISCDYDTSLDELQEKFPKSNLYLIKPDYDLGNLFNGTLNFHKNKLSESFELGYKNGMEFSKNFISQSYIT